MNALPQKVSAVTVTEPVDGTTKRRTRGKGKRTPVSRLNHLVVDRRVWAAAQSLLDGSYTRVEIVDHETVVVR